MDCPLLFLYQLDLLSDCLLSVVMDSSMEIQIVTFFNVFSFVMYALFAIVKSLVGTIYVTDEMIGCSCTCQKRLKDLDIDFFVLTFLFQMIS